MNATGSAEIVHRQILTDAGDVHCIEAGDGPALLLLHGDHGGWGHWLMNIAPLSMHARVIAPDLAGFGDSYDPGRRLMPDEQAALMVEVLDRLAIGTATVAGVSFGALVAIEMALIAPTRVVSLLLVDPPVPLLAEVQCRVRVLAGADDSHDQPGAFTAAALEALLAHTTGSQEGDTR